MYVHVCTEDNLRCCSQVCLDLCLHVLRFECLSGIGPCLGTGLNLEIMKTDIPKHPGDQSLSGEVTQ